MAACNRLSQPVPQSVVVNAGNPLKCTLLTEPKVIETLTATYGCAAPGAYLESVDTKKMEASYFTTDSAGVTITYGPTTFSLESVMY
jgi:hypothetical protein